VGGDEQAHTCEDIIQLLMPDAWVLHSYFAEHTLDTSQQSHKR
jgi:hypothetical protein